MIQMNKFADKFVELLHEPQIEERLAREIAEIKSEADLTGFLELCGLLYDPTEVLTDTGFMQVEFPVRRNCAVRLQLRIVDR